MSVAKEENEVTREDWRAAEQVLNSILAKAFHPGDHLQVDTWAENKLELSPRVSRYSGLIKLDRTPYMRGPLRAIMHSRYRRILLVWGAQTGKTLVLQIVIGYSIDQDPGPMLVAFPDKKFAKTRARKHIRPLIEDSAVLRRHMTGRRDDLQNFELTLDTMTITIGWAGSPSAMAGEPIRRLVRDEIAKHKQRDKDEGDPLLLSARRIISFGELGQIVDATTPSTTENSAWKDLLASTFHERWLPCPHCGRPDDVADIPDPVMDGDRDAMAKRLTAAGYQTLRFEQFKGFSGLREPDAVKAATYYECEHCKARIDHRQVVHMDRRGVWLPRKMSGDTAGFHLPSWYRDLTSTSWGEVAARFVASLGDPEKMRDWKNSDEATGFEEQGETKTLEQILSLRRDYAPKTIPFIPLAVLMTVDVRGPELHVTLRAWTEYETNALLLYEIIPRMPTGLRADTEPTGETLAGLDHYLNLTFPAPDGRQYGVDLCGIDSGWDTDEVYAFCRKRRACVAMKAEYGQADTIRYSQPEKLPGTTERRADSCWLFAWQHKYFADVWAAKLNVSKNAPGEVMLHRETGSDYAEHQVSERKVIVKNKMGRVTITWKKFSQNNHFLDNERQQVVLARYLQLADKRLPEEAQQIQRSIPPPAGTLHRDFSDFTGRLRQ